MPKIDLETLFDDMEQVEASITNEFYIPPYVKHKFINSFFITISKIHGVLIALKYIIKMLPDIIKISLIEPSALGNIGLFMMPVFDWQYSPLLALTIKRLESHQIVIRKSYEGVLKKMAAVMMHYVPLDSPIIITASPGLGKTEMLISTLIIRSKEKEFNAIVVTRRIEDAIRIASEVNDEVGEEVCWVRPTFALMTQNGKRCPNGYLSKDWKVKRCSSPNCKIDVQTCPVKRSYKSYILRRIIIITTKFLHNTLDDGSLNQIRKFKHKHDSEAKLRKYIFIDENPGMVFNNSLTENKLSDCVVHLETQDFARLHIDEFRNAKGLIAQLMGGKENYEYVNAQNTSFKLSKGFIRAWNNNPHDDHHNIPEIINGLIDDGGIKQNGNKIINYSIAINRYREIRGRNLRTVILDGTGFKDLTYREKDFSILRIKDIRDYSRATLHHYPANLSKSYLSKGTRQKIEDIANEISRAVGRRKTLVVVYKLYKEQFIQLLEPYENITIDHFGNLIGRNDYRHCTAVYFVGYQNFGTIDYFNQLTAVKGKKIDLSTRANKESSFKSEEVNRFFYGLISLSLYQDLMRSNLRKIGARKKVNIYIWAEGDRIIELLKVWLPGCNYVIEQIPANLRSTRQSKLISSDAASKLQVYIDSKTEADDELKTKKRVEKLARVLGRIPTRAELEFVWEDMKSKSHRSHYPRYKDYAEEYLARENTG